MSSFYRRSLIYFVICLTKGVAPSDTIKILFLYCSEHLQKNYRGVSPAKLKRYYYHSAKKYWPFDNF